MISPDLEQIIRAAAIAERAYLKLIREAADNPRHRLELVDCRVMIDQELGGEPRRPPAPPNILEPISVAVDRELETMRPAAEWRVIRWRATRRLAGCGYVQLSLSKAADMRRRIRQVVKDSGVTIAEFAEVLGITESTMHDHLGKGKIPKARAAWYRRLQSIAVNKKTIVLTIRRAPGR